MAEEKGRCICSFPGLPLSPFFFIATGHLHALCPLACTRNMARSPGCIIITRTRVLTVHRQSARTRVTVRPSLDLRAHQNPFYNPLIPPGYWSPPPSVFANAGDLRPYRTLLNRIAARAIVFFPSNYAFFSLISK